MEISDIPGTSSAFHPWHNYIRKINIYTDIDGNKPKQLRYV